MAPQRVDGILARPASARGAYACPACGGPLNALTLRPGVEVCRACALAYSVHKTTLGALYHIFDIEWDGPGLPYRSARIAWHPPDHTCKDCLGVG